MILALRVLGSSEVKKIVHLDPMGPESGDQPEGCARQGAVKHGLRAREYVRTELTACSHEPATKCYSRTGRPRAEAFYHAR